MQSWLGIKQRPQDFRITPNQNHWARRGLVFAGLGQHPKGLRFHDSSLYGNNGTLTDMDSTAWVFDTQLGRWALTFAANDYVNGTLGANFVGEFTVCLWMKGVSSTSSGYSACGNYTGANGWLMGPNNSTTFYYGAKPSGSLYTANVTGHSGSEWMHYAFSFVPDSGIYLYRNGVLVSSKTDSPPSSLVSSAQTFKLGNRGDLAADFVGSQTDHLFYSRAISQSQIQQLADPSNVMLSGLILPPAREMFPTATISSFPSTIQLPTLQLAI